MFKSIIIALFSLLFVVSLNAQSNPESSPTPEEKEAEYKPADEKVNETDAFLTYSFESLSNDRGSWQEARFDFVHRFTKRQVLYGGYRETDRFNLRDREATIGLYQPLDQKWTLNLEASASPTSRVLPRWSGKLGVERSFGNGWIGKTSYKRTERENAKVNTFSGGFDKYWGKNLASYAFSLNNLENTGTSPSQRIRYSRFYKNDSSFNIGFAFGDEVEQIDQSNVLKSSIRNISMDGTHRFSPSWSLRYGFGFHRQGQIYDRRRVSVGLRLDF